jgi:hypothetical protein
VSIGDAVFDVNCNAWCVGGLRIRGLTRCVKTLNMAHRSNTTLRLQQEISSMNRHFIATHARTVLGADALVRRSGHMTLNLGWVQSNCARSRGPGEGDAASP